MGCATARLRLPIPCPHAVALGLVPSPYQAKGVHVCRCGCGGEAEHLGRQPHLERGKEGWEVEPESLGNRPSRWWQAGGVTPCCSGAQCHNGGSMPAVKL